jgi:hypothetical protein
MDTEKRTAQVVGALFIVATVASIAGSVVLGSVLEEADYLVGLADHAGRVILAVGLFLVAATSAFATSFLLFPILRRQSEGLAAGYVGLRAFENVFYVAGSIGLLVMLTVSQDDTIGSAAAPDLALLGAALVAIQKWSVVLGTVIFAGLGCLVLVGLGHPGRRRGPHLRRVRPAGSWHRPRLSPDAPRDAARGPGDGVCLGCS